MLPILIIIDIQNNPENIIKDILYFVLIYILLVIVPISKYWKYWIDIFKKEIILFEVEVFSEGQVEISKVESAWENWILTEKGKDTPQSFFICLRQMRKYYNNTNLVQDMCCGPVSFTYLKRTKCIVEIKSIYKPELYNKNKKVHKKSKRKSKK